MAFRIKTSHAFLSAAVLASCSGKPEGPETGDTEAICPGVSCADLAPLFLSITAPGRSALSTRDRLLRVDGVSSPNTEFVKYRNLTTAVEGYANGTQDWSASIPLIIGDNEIEIRAMAEGFEEARASLLVVYSDAIEFVPAVQVEPPFALLGMPEPIRIFIGITPTPGTEIDSVTLRAGPDEIAQLRDDGRLPADDVESDGVYSGIIESAPDAPTLLRAIVRYQRDGQTSALASPPYLLETRIPLSAEAYDEVRSIQELGLASLQAAADRVANASQMMEQVRADLEAQPDVVGATISEGGWSVSVRLTNGFETSIARPYPESRGGRPSPSDEVLGIVTRAQSTAPNVRSKQVLVASPFRCEFEPKDEGNEVATIYESVECPSFDVTYLNDTDVTLAALRRMSEFGIIHISTHGDAKENDAWFYLREELNDRTREAYRYELAIRPDGGGAMVTPAVYADACLGGAARHSMAIRPEFVQHVASRKPFPSSLVFLSACRSTYNLALSSAFRAGGAEAYLGFSEYVQSSFAHDLAVEFHEGFATGESAKTLFVPGQDDLSFAQLLQTLFGQATRSPAFWELFSLRDLRGPVVGLFNGGFEAGTVEGWRTEGDARALRSLGAFQPISGEWLGIVSTGLGTQDQPAVLRQRVCVAADKTSLDLHRNFLSEEFPEFCGDRFQDFFTVSLEQAGQQFPLHREAVDDLCGLTSPAGIGFDQGDVQSSGWRELSLPLPGDLVRARPFDLVIRSGDIGDSIFDTGILLDGIEFR